MSIVANNARRIIEEKGFKQSSIAIKAGFDAKIFNSMLQGRKIVRDDYILPIANALGVTPNELFKDN